MLHTCNSHSPPAQWTVTASPLLRDCPLFPLGHGRAHCLARRNRRISPSVHQIAHLASSLTPLHCLPIQDLNMHIPVQATASVQPLPPPQPPSPAPGKRLASETKALSLYAPPPLPDAPSPSSCLNHHLICPDISSSLVHIFSITNPSSESFPLLDKSVVSPVTLHGRPCPVPTHAPRAIH